MEGSGNSWIDIGIAAGKWALAGIATLGSSAVIYIGRRYREDSEKLEEAAEYVARLKKLKLAGRTVAHARVIRTLKRQLSAALRENKTLREEIRLNTIVLKQYEAACQNLSAAVELRAKEHHEFRNDLQLYLTRLTVIETKLNIKDQWRHDPK